MPKRIQHEHIEQTLLIKWFYLQYPTEIIIHIPNELIRTCTQAMRAVLAGMVTGAPDLFMPVARGEYHGLFIEMKRKAVKGKPKGVVSERQKQVIEHLESRKYLCQVCHGFEQARTAIMTYMILKDKS